MTFFLNLLFPPQCLVCNQPVTGHGTLCLTCWQGIRFISDPFCACCGNPFDYDLGKDTLCGACLKERPLYSRARSVLRYDDASRALVTKLKYTDQAHLSSIYGKWLHQCGRDLVANSDVIVPVPLHYWRFLGRRYNQSALLAYALKKHCALPVLPDGLKRTRSTRPQPGLTRKQRADNVKNAFAATPRFISAIKHKSILLIDDVMTTSATTHECTATLLKAGASNVNVLTLARKAG